MTIQHKGSLGGGGGGGLELISGVDDYLFNSHTDESTYHTLDLPSPPGGSWSRLRIQCVTYNVLTATGPIDDPYGDDYSSTRGSTAPSVGHYFHKGDLYGSTAYVSTNTGGWYDWFDELAPLADTTDLDVDFVVGLIYYSTRYLEAIVYNLENNNLRIANVSSRDAATARVLRAGATHLIIEGA